MRFFSVGSESSSVTGTTRGQSFSAPTKFEKIWDIVSECIFKEFGSVLRNVLYRAVFWIDPHKYDLNPIKVKAADKVNQTANVVLLLHGDGAHQSCFFPLAKKFSDAGIRNVYTVSIKQSDDDPIPLTSLVTHIEEITKKYLDNGYSDVQYALVGHSLGALVSAKYIWRGEHHVDKAGVSMMISIAGRLKYVANRFFWFCDDVKSEIEETYRKICEDPDKATLYMIWGSKDAIVPKQSVHIQGENSREITVKGWGHGGVVFAPDAHNSVVSWTKDWLKS